MKRLIRILLGAVLLFGCRESQPVPMTLRDGLFQKNYPLTWELEFYPLPSARQVAPRDPLDP